MWVSSIRKRKSIFGAAYNREEILLSDITQLLAQLRGM